MWRKVSELSAEQRQAIEALLGRPLGDDEGLSIHASRVVKEAPTGEERVRAYGRLLEHLDKLSRRADGVADEQLDAAIDEACDRVRHHRT